MSHSLIFDVIQKCGIMLAFWLQQEVSGSYVTWQTEQQGFSLCVCGCVFLAWLPSCVSPQDGLVQAAAFREGLQRLLHQDRHQKGSQVSEGKTGKGCRANMWLSSFILRVALQRNSVFAVIGPQICSFKEKLHNCRARWRKCHDICIFFMLKRPKSLEIK